MSNLGGNDLYLERTNSLTKRVVITYHRVWEIDRFLKFAIDEEAKKKESCEKEGKPSDFDFIATSDRDAYKAFTKGGGGK